MAEELKACPFCGRIPKTSHRPESEASGGGHVAFVVCYCGGYASTAHQMGHAETVQAAIAEVVEKWNTRAQLPSQGDEAVAWQAGFIESGDAWDAWQTCSKEHHDFVKRCPNEWPDYEVRALYTHPADQVANIDPDKLAQFIRQIDGDNRMGAGALAEHICEWLAKP